MNDQVILDQLCINTIRALSMDAIQKANSGRAAYMRLTLGLSRVPANWKEWAFSALRSRARSAPNS